jgi:peptidoglycan-associated lipoprotein
VDQTKGVIMKSIFSVIFKVTLIGALSLGLVACQSKKKTSDEAGAGSGSVSSQNTGDNAPAIDSSAMSFDPTGSDSGKISGLTSINFEYDRATLSEKAKQGLKANSEWLRRNAGFNLQIEGHCDSRGSTEYNLSLGERRAETVKSYMVNLGIAENRLSTVSYGKERLLSQGDTEADHVKNRRANFVPVSSSLK